MTIQNDILIKNCIESCKDIFNDYTAEEMSRCSGAVQLAWEAGKQAVNTTIVAPVNFESEAERLHEITENQKITITDLSAHIFNLEQQINNEDKKIWLQFYNSLIQSRKSGIDHISLYEYMDMTDEMLNRYKEKFDD